MTDSDWKVDFAGLRAKIEPEPRACLAPGRLRRNGRGGHRILANSEPGSGCGAAACALSAASDAVR